MLSTEELEQYVYNEMNDRLGKVSCKTLFFCRRNT